MAQRTGAERFLASPAKTASAGLLCLALAVAAPLLTGCGGSSSDPASQSNSSTSASAQAPQSSTKPPSAQAKKAAAKRDGQGSESSNPQGGGGQKHGPRIAQPKSEATREHAPTPAETADATIVDMTLTSPSLPLAQEGLAAIPAAYTCDGKGSWPALRWAGTPAATRELALLVMSAKPVEGRLFFDWAVAGLDPSLESLGAGELPKSAVVGTNSFGKRGYEICPPPGGAETYIFALFALPSALSPKQGFDPAALREEILALAGNAGLLTAIYSRG